MDLELYVFIDLVKVAQAFRNLLNNAFEHTPPGGSVTIRTSRVWRQSDDGSKVCYVI
jgi:signal transduction histidine kinase